MKFKRLNEVRTKYWNGMNGARYNYTDILIAYEVSSNLQVVPMKTMGDFDRFWATEMKVAKDVIREMHKEVLGFNVHNALEMTRRFHQYRLLDTRISNSRFYWDLLNHTLTLAKPHELLDDVARVEAESIAQRVLNTKRESVNAFLSPRGTRDYEYLVNDLVDEADRTLAALETSRTSTEINRIFGHVETLMVLFVDLVALSNSLDFPKYSEAMVNNFIVTSFKAITNEDLNVDVLKEAVKELVE